MRRDGRPTVIDGDHFSSPPPGPLADCDFVPHVPQPMDTVWIPSATLVRTETPACHILHVSLDHLTLSAMCAILRRDPVAVI